MSISTSISPLRVAISAVLTSSILLACTPSQKQAQVQHPEVPYPEVPHQAKPPVSLIDEVAVITNPSIKVKVENETIGMSSGLKALLNNGGGLISKLSAALPLLPKEEVKSPLILI